MEQQLQYLRGKRKRGRGEEGGEGKEGGEKVRKKGGKESGREDGKDGEKEVLVLIVISVEKILTSLEPMYHVYRFKVQ